MKFYEYFAFKIKLFIYNLFLDIYLKEKQLVIVFISIVLMTHCLLHYCLKKKKKL